MNAAPTWVRYLLATALFAAALVVRLALVGLLPAEGYPFLTFFPAVLLATYLAGLGAGLFAALLSILAAWFFFMGPTHMFAQLSRPDALALVVFSVVLFIGCIVVHVMNTALARVRHTQDLLRASEHRLRRVLDDLYVYVALLDVDGTVREVNDAPLLAARVQREQVQGRPFWEAPWWTPDPAQVAAVRAAVERAARGETVRYDARVERAPGKSMTIDLQLAPLREPDGRISVLVASGTDVTERVRTLEALASSRQEALAAAEAAEAERRVLDATFDAVPAGVVIADAEGRLLRVNRTHESLWGPAPAPGGVADYAAWKGWWADGSPRQGQRVQPHEWGLARALRGERCRDIVEIEPFDRPHDHRITLMSAAPVRSPTGQVVGGVVAQVDITDRIRAEQALRETDRQKDMFLATLAHELRNPLAPIRSAAELIRLRRVENESVRKAGAIIERQSAQLARLVEDLLDVSRVTFGSMRLQCAPVDLRQVVDSALETSRPQVQAAGHALEVRMPAQPLVVQADETRVAQCVANLVNNACKFTRSPGGRITVEVQPRDERWASVRVQDNGQGISREMLGRVFELFAQEQRSGMDGHSGLGIGLALTRKLVEMHGGQVLGRSAGPGQGAEFEILLPLLQPAGPPPVGGH